MGIFNLTGKVAVVTGSSRGIGYSIAENLAKENASVIISSRKTEACEAAVKRIQSVGGVAHAIPANIGKKNDIENLISETKKTFGKIDLLVCNAASNPFYGSMSELPDEAFQKILQNNVISNHWLANLVLPDMAERKSGTIIIVSSIGGLKGTDKLGAYAISKAADMQLARNLSIEWGSKNITVNCIAPGLIKTDFAKALWENEKIRKHYEELTPLKRVGDPDDIGGIAVFLASKAGAFVPGQTIGADGGVTIAG